MGRLGEAAIRTGVLKLCEWQGLYFQLKTLICVILLSEVSTLALPLMCLTDRLTSITVTVHLEHQLRVSESKIKKERICFPFKKSSSSSWSVQPTTILTQYNQLGADAIWYP